MSTKPGDWWDESLNPWENCTPCSEACQNCWALSMIRRFRGWEPGNIHYFLGRTEKITTWRKRRHVFVCSLSDVFHEAVPDNMIMDLLNFLAWPFSGTTHTYYLLTKRPARLAELWSKFKAEGVTEIPAHIRLGITVENQARLEERWEHLVPIPTAVKFLHAEPLLGPLDLSGIIEHVQWVVVGGENGPKARPMHPDWVRSIRDQCVAAGVSFWFKSWGTNDEDVTEFGQNDGWPRTLDGRTWEERPE